MKKHAAFVMSHMANIMDSKSDSLNEAGTAGMAKQRRPSEEITPDWRNLTSIVSKLPITAMQQNVDTIVRLIFTEVVQSDTASRRVLVELVRYGVLLLLL